MTSPDWSLKSITNSPGRGELRVVSINRSRSALSADDHERYGAGIEQSANVVLAIEAHELVGKICRIPSVIAISRTVSRRA